MSGNLSRSMRENYDTHGVDEYYKIVGSSYRNPHFPGIKKSIDILMNKWWPNESDHLSEESGMLVCDLAAGSGEATIALREWWSKCCGELPTVPVATPNPSLRTSARPVIARPPVNRPPSTATSSRPSLHAPYPRISMTTLAPRIVAIDPYTADAYLQRTGSSCMELSFQDIAQDGLPKLPTLVTETIPDPNDSQEHTDDRMTGPVRQPYDLVVCSFALHLITSPGELFALLSTLSYDARWLVVLEPHKKPEIKEEWGWELWNVTSWGKAEIGPGNEVDFVAERVHCRVYKSINL